MPSETRSMRAYTAETERAESREQREEGKGKREEGKS